MKKKVRLLDITLRDGEQAPTVAFNSKTKIKIIELLENAGINNIEIGFPIVSKEEVQTIKQIVKHNSRLNFNVLARLHKKDIDLAVECGVKNITIFVPASTYHLKNSLNLIENEIPCHIKTVITYAKSKGCKIKFSPENASRMDLKKLLKYYQIAIDAGADLISFADTAGIILPDQMYKIVKEIKKKINIELSVHLHNDLGLATANAVMAYQAGVDEIQVCINGIGERCGNVPLEEIVTILETRLDVDTGIDLKNLKKLSEFVYRETNEQPSLRKPVWGEHAFTHESDIHIQSLLANESIYAPYVPSLVNRTHKFKVGKHSGYTSIKNYLLDSISNVTTEDIKEVIKKIKTAAEKKSSINIEDIVSEIRSLKSIKK